MQTPQPIEKTYQLAGCCISIKYRKQLISIAQLHELLIYLNTATAQRSDELAILIKEDHKNLFGSPLNISTRSIVVEIWGHVFAGQVAKLLKRILPFRPINKLANFVINRCDVIDCGEKGIDTNRWVWDFLSVFKPILGLGLRLCLPKKQDSGHLSDF